MRTPDRDQDILRAVDAACESAQREGDNWANYLPDYVHCEARYAADLGYIGTLPDQRTIWLSDESASGAGQYSIRDAETEDEDDG